MEVARGVGKEAVVEVLAKYTKLETEVTEVSQQLHVVISGHNYATKFMQQIGAPLVHSCMHMHNHTCIHTHTHSLSLVYNLVRIHLCTH